jgi:hypothetical protein
MLMKRLEQEARARKLKTLTGYIFSENIPMRALMVKLGYANTPCSEDSSMLMYRLTL